MGVVVQGPCPRLHFTPIAVPTDREVDIGVIRIVIAALCERHPATLPDAGCANLPLQPEEAEVVSSRQALTNYTSITFQSGVLDEDIPHLRRAPITKHCVRQFFKLLLISRYCVLGVF